MKFFTNEEHTDWQRIVGRFDVAGVEAQVYYDRMEFECGSVLEGYRLQASYMNPECDAGIVGGSIPVVAATDGEALSEAQGIVAALARNWTRLRSSSKPSELACSQNEGSAGEQEVYRVNSTRIGGGRVGGGK